MTMNKKFEGTGAVAKEDPPKVPKMTDEQIMEARRVVQEFEAEMQQRRDECSKEIAAVCKKFGFQLHVDLVNPQISISLRPIE